MRMAGNVDREKVFHSSLMGQAQSGSNFGTTTSESFRQRQTLEGRRVQKYQQSKLGTGAVPTDLRMQRRAVYRPDANNTSKEPASRTGSLTPAEKVRARAEGRARAGGGAPR